MRLHRSFSIKNKKGWKVMGRLLDKYASQYKGDGRVPVEKQTVVPGDAYATYEAAKKKGTAMECVFDFADADGNLFLTDSNGITLRLNAEDFKKSAPYYSARIKDRFIGLNIYVKVSDIDRENGVVRVVSNGATNEIKGQLIKELMIELDKRKNDPELEPISLWGDVVGVNEKSVMVNILHKNILGFISKGDWSQSRIRDLTIVANVGDVVKFDVYAPAKKKPGKDIAFQCTRKPYAPDPWVSLPDFPEGSTMIVECVSKPKGKSYFWGQSKSTPEIDVMCDYSHRFEIMRGCTYKCKVVRYDKGEHILRVVPFEQIDHGIFNAANVAFVKGRKREAVNGD